jgi:hypothetical protein
MNRSQFDAMVSREMDAIMTISNTKGRDAAGDDDVLSALGRRGRMAITERQVWGVLASKHWLSIETWVATGDLKSESIESRIHDLILYLFMALAMIEEGR